MFPLLYSSIVCSDAYNNEITICISNDYNVYSFGKSEYGTNEHNHQNNFPTQIKYLTNIKMIDCGHSHTICLSYNGDVYSFGKNNYGKLGIGSIDKLKQTHIPQKINIPSCNQVSCGDNFTFCLTDDNQLYSFGCNNNGQFGLGNYKRYELPKLIPNFNNIEYIVCGGEHSICKTYNNEFYSWGSNNYGQLGQGKYSELCNKPIQCLNWPDNIISIKCGYNHSLLLTSEGQVYSFGSNYYGQLGINDKDIESINSQRLIKDIPEIQRIECGYRNTLCIDINDNLWLFGCNGYGQLGLGDQENRYKPTIHPTLSNISDISSRGCHTFVKTIDNKIYAFGYNNHSQLGIETLERYNLTPIQVFQDNEEIWCSFIGKSKGKSARK